MTHEKRTSDDESTRTVVKEALAALGNSKKEYEPHNAYACPNFEQKFEEQLNKRSLKAIGIVGGSILALAGSILGIYIGMTSDLITLKKDLAVTNETISRVEKNQLTSRELGEAIAVGLKPIIEQIQRESAINNEQEKAILRLNIKSGEFK
jgi:hypothetical protein